MASIHFLTIDCFPQTFQRGAERYEEAQEKWEVFQALGIERNDLDAESFTDSVIWRIRVDSDKLADVARTIIDNGWTDEMSISGYSEADDRIMKEFEEEIEYTGSRESRW